MVLERIEKMELQEQVQELQQQVLKLCQIVTEAQSEISRLQKTVGIILDYADVCSNSHRKTFDLISLIEKTLINLVPNAEPIITKTTLH